VVEPSAQVQPLPLSPFVSVHVPGRIWGYPPSAWLGIGKAGSSTAPTNTLLYVCTASNLTRGLRSTAFWIGLWWTVIRRCPASLSAWLSPEPMSIILPWPRNWLSSPTRLPDLARAGDCAGGAADVGPAASVIMVWVASDASPAAG
jgi:hypothetical protein